MQLRLTTYEVRLPEKPLGLATQPTHFESSLLINIHNQMNQ